MAIKTTNDLIINAYYLINEYAPNEYPSDFEIRQGLDLLNDYINYLSGENVNIPYVHDIVFDIEPNKNIYKFSKLSTADVDTNKFIYIQDAFITTSDALYNLNIIPNNIAFNILSDNFQETGMPRSIYMQNDNEETKLLFLPIPDLNYSCTLRVKSVLENLSLFTDITTLPKKYFRFLRYALAKELSSIFETNNWDSIKENEFNLMYNSVISGNDFDFGLNLSPFLLYHG